MESIAATLLAMLEMTFVFVSLALLHSLRKVIGKAAFYIALGLLFVFTQFVSAAELRVYTGIVGFDFYIGHTGLFLPYLGALMLVYITEGTLEAQRLIIGAMAALGLFLYLSGLTITQCNWIGHAIAQGTTANTLDFLISQARKTMAGATLSQTLDLFLLPIFFQRLRNFKCRMFFCVLGALMFTQLADTFVYLSVTYWGQPHWWLYINSSFIIKSIATVWICFLVSLYLSRIEKEIPGEERRALDIVFAFFGGYGKARRLEKDLLRWEGRYQLVVENASEMILLVGHDGKVIDANQAAVRILKENSRNDILGRSYFGQIRDEQGHVLTEEKFQSFFRHVISSEKHIEQLRCSLDIGDKQIFLDMAVSAIERDDVQIMIILGRDITEEVNLSREKELLSEQLAHSQRLEAIGRLAGGVAHDFNNYIHAIIGHLDVIRYIYHSDDEKINRQLDKISDISEQAGQLTGQLLGFARKGKFNVQEIDLRKLLQNSIDLFLPKSHRNLDFEYHAKDRPMLILGDSVQMQQAILNLLLNAMDAMEQKNAPEMLLKIIADEAVKSPVELLPPDGQKADPSHFFCITVEDNGIGMSKKVQQRIFEPFFTTKPYGKGTGMGLAMVYGTITNHGGWIQLVSKENIGTGFYLFLPKKQFAQNIAERSRNAVMER